MKELLVINKDNNRYILMDKESNKYDLTIYIEDEKFPGFITKLSKDLSFYTILEKDYNIQPKHAVLEIDGIIAQNQHADLLKCNIGDPLFSINKISYDFEDKPIHYSSTIVRCDRATYVVHTDNSTMMNTQTKSR